MLPILLADTSLGTSSLDTHSFSFTVNIPPCMQGVDTVIRDETYARSPMPVGMENRANPPDLRESMSTKRVFPLAKKHSLDGTM